MLTRSQTAPVLGEKYEESKNSYLTRLIELGVEQIGKGSWGTVFQHPTMPDVVVKVFTDKDRAFASYVEWARKNQHNKYVVRMIGAQEGLKLEKKGGYSILFIEKLKPLTRPIEKKFMNRLPERLIGLLMRLTTSPRDELRIRYLSKAHWRIILTESQDRDLVSFSSFLLAGMNSGFNKDLSPSNTLQRGNQVVFSDPSALPF